ncbi:MAG: phosphoribosylamine--glycine ligase, partial [Gemmatimonadales bacterium]
PIFGPTAGAAQIEASKAFAKQLMAECGVPTAAFRVFRDPGEARAFVTDLQPPVVVKASGLAGGKGALICPDRASANAAIHELMEEGAFGEAGAEIVIEEFMRGRELSVFFVTDGRTAVPLAPARDHKRRYEGGEGPNTGGMGAFAPVPGADTALIDRVRREVAEPVLAGLAERGHPYRGFLYAGLMLTEEGPKVVEFNCRLGDPETQAVLPLMRDSLLEPLRAVAWGGDLDGWRPEPPTRAALTTVVVSGTYPGPVAKGRPIDLPDDIETDDVHVYHAGTRLEDGRLVTDGGRVFGVTGLGPDLETAGERSRAAAARIRFEGADWRPDIGRADTA